MWSLNNRKSDELKLDQTRCRASKLHQMSCQEAVVLLRQSDPKVIHLMANLIGLSQPTPCIMLSEHPFPWRWGKSSQHGRRKGIPRRRPSARASQTQHLDGPRSGAGDPHDPGSSPPFISSLRGGTIQGKWCCPQIWMFSQWRPLHPFLGMTVPREPNVFSRDRSLSLRMVQMLWGLCPTEPCELLPPPP